VVCIRFWDLVHTTVGRWPLFVVGSAKRRHLLLFCARNRCLVNHCVAFYGERGSTTTAADNGLLLYAAASYYLPGGCSSATSLIILRRRLPTYASGSAGLNKRSLVPITTCPMPPVPFPEYRPRWTLLFADGHATRT